MNSKWEELYHDMQADLSRCLALPHPQKDNAENCFWIARNYWDRVQQLLNRAGFAGDVEEINFYREVKPMFARYIEYYSLLSEGLSFEPPPLPFPDNRKGKQSEQDWTQAWHNSVREYWRVEQQRGERFYTKNKLVLDYMESGDRDNDTTYFLSRSNAAGDPVQRRVHNRDSLFFTAAEEIITTWEAYKLYSEYIQSKLHEPVGS